ncbi:hypothetical protein [Methylobacterium sp. Leaf117]|uniref:hypothetical protein n=1 Tax=Methylobacterium sp. Leaf117 TaxID=1736260 RepID=UPI0006F5223E|nr:hypothetical protein [Methylobacterium sp. Leaf117]KQP95460.1 hypothetical protein ASF57_20575 [Methylobacterium sp. Leaf117]
MTGRTLVILLGGAVLLTVTTLVAVPFWAVLTAMPDRARPSLVQNLPPEFARGDAAFAARIADTFPLGSSEGGLISRLRAEGFSSDPPAANPAEGRRAWFVLSEPSCTLTWRVGWRAEDGRLASVAGAYGGTCL